MTAVLARLRPQKVVADGLWSGAATVGSKVLALAVLFFVARCYGVATTGVLAVSTGVAMLACTVADLGLSSAANRGFAAVDGLQRDDVVRAVRRRSVTAAVVAVTGAAITGRAAELSPGSLVWLFGTAVYGVGFFANQVLTQAAYGTGRFERASVVNGLVRLGAALPVGAVALLHGPPGLVLVVLGAAELLGAVSQARSLPCGSPVAGDRSAFAPLFTLRQTWQYGFGGVVNTIINRSDAVVVGVVASVVAVGTYSVASQLQNALTTSALIPAAAVVTHAARAAGDRTRRAAVLRSALAAVGGIYLVVAVPALVFANTIVAFLFDAPAVDALPLRVCVVGGLFSCLAAVVFQQLVGMGARREIVVIWSISLVLAVPSLLVGASVAGALGAAVGATVRDVGFLTFAVLFYRRKQAEAGPGDEVTA